MIETNYDQITKIRSYRWVSAIVSGTTMIFVSGFFSALLFSAAIIATAYLDSFSLFVPKMLRNESGAPAAWAENLLPFGMMCLAALVFAIMGHDFAAFIIGLAAIIDFMKDRLNIVETLKSRINK